MNLKITLAVVGTIVAGIACFIFLNKDDSSSLANSSLVENTSAATTVDVSAETSTIPAEEETAQEVTTSVNIEVEGKGTVAFNGEYVGANGSYNFANGADAMLTIESGDNEVEIIANGLSLGGISEYDLNSLGTDTISVSIKFTEKVVETPVVVTPAPVEVVVETPKVETPKEEVVVEKPAPVVTQKEETPVEVVTPAVETPAASTNTTTNNNASSSSSSGGYSVGGYVISSPELGTSPIIQNERVVTDEEIANLQADYTSTDAPRSGVVFGTK